MPAAFAWGTQPQERAREYACDVILPLADHCYFRGVDVKASPAVLFRWLCQLRAAPYSYDWLDNFGRRSPRRLIAGIDNLALGQRFMTIFELVAFEPENHLTMRLIPQSGAELLFGQMALTYQIVPLNRRCRLLAKIVINYPPGLKGRLMKAFLPWGDLVMMRKQLLTLKALVEGQELAGLEAV